MAIALSLAAANPRRNHRIVDLTIGAVTTWQSITGIPTWVNRVEVINHGADSLFLTTEAEDGDAGSGGVEVRAGGSYSFPCGGSDTPYILVRHASGSYTFAVGLGHSERY